MIYTCILIYAFTYMHIYAYANICIYIYMCMRMCIYRSSRLEVFCKKGVLRNFSKFKVKHLCQSPFFNKVAKIETLAQVFSYEFCEIAKNILFYRAPPVAASVYTNVYVSTYMYTSMQVHIYIYILLNGVCRKL